MGSFLSALSALAPIAPASYDARELIRRRQMETQAFQADLAARRQALAEGQQLGRLREQEIAQSAQKTRAGEQPTIFGQPEWDPIQGSWTALAIDPKKGLTRIPVPGGESPSSTQARQFRESVASYKQVTGHDPSPEMQNAFFASAYGIKLPSSYGRLGQRFTDPSTGLQYERVIGEDGMEHVEPLMGPRGKQLGGLKPETETDITRMELKQDANGNWVEVPVSSRTVRKPISGSTTGGITISSGGGGVRPTGVHGKLSSQDAGLMQSAQEIQTAANDVLPLLEQTKGRNGLMDRAAAETAWLQYRAGFTPSDPLYRQIIKPIALLAGIGSSQWTRVGRGKYLFDRISQHLPHPSDTPALLYDKIKWLSDNVSKETQKAVMQPVPEWMTPSGQGAPSGDPAVDEFLRSVGGGR